MVQMKKLIHAPPLLPLMDKAALLSNVVWLQGFGPEVVQRLADASTEVCVCVCVCSWA